MRNIYSFDNDWRYHAEVPGESVHNDGYGPMYVSAKTERIKCGPGAYKHFDVENSWNFDDEIPNEKWQNVTLPHDYIIRQKPDPERGSPTGFVNCHNAWYRKHFKLSPEMRGKRITLLFGAVSGNSAIYLNGCLIKYNHCAYTPIEADITDYVRFDCENVVAVYIDMSLIEGWWYRGAGIYRHAKLIVTDKLCVDLYGDYVRPVFNGSKWKLDITTTVRNDEYDDAEVKLIHHIFDSAGNERALYETVGNVGARSLCDISFSGTFGNPKLWDIDSPVLYTLFTEVVSGGGIRDTYKTKFGFRTAHFGSDGFWLNGRRIKIKGVCAHQDFGLTGLAVPDNIFDYKIKMLKEMGANGYRTAHYPHPEEIMDALDKYGFLVMAEVRHFDSNEESMRQTELAVKRDRNRPSVILWSTGNEELRYHNLEQGINIQRAMAAHVKKLDPSRPVTTAVGRPENSTVMPFVDVIGINYSLEQLDKFHEKFPDKAVLSTENCAIRSSFGNYTGNHPELGLVEARDCVNEPNHPGREETWKFIAERSWLAGGYQWSAFEYRGEAAFPRLNSISGAIDLFLRPKDAFYQNKSHWTDEPMIHLLPHWDHRGLEGREINVWAYTNCDEAELYLNGKLIGKKTIEKYSHAEWNVKYAPGELKVVGFINGAKAAEDVINTSGKPYALKLCEETKPIHAGGNEMAILACTIVDENGIYVRDARPLVRFEAGNGAEIEATGSANFDQTPPYFAERRMYAGRITVGVTSKNPGKVTVYAYADGLLSAALDIEILEKSREDEVVSCSVAGDKIEAGHV